MIRRLFILTLVVSVSLPPGFATPPPLPKFAPLEFHPPKPDRVALSTGLVLFLLEDHELPLIRIQMLVKAGQQYDPADEVGLSTLFGAVWEEGGSEHHSPEDIERIVDTTGGSISFSTALEQVSGALTAPTKDFD